jgi:hypothetical protein
MTTSYKGGTTMDHQRATKAETALTHRHGPRTHPARTWAGTAPAFELHRTSRPNIAR